MISHNIDKIKKNTTKRDKRQKNTGAGWRAIRAPPQRARLLIQQQMTCIEYSKPIR